MVLFFVALNPAVQSLGVATAAPSEPGWWDPTPQLMQTIPQQPKTPQQIICQPKYEWPCEKALKVAKCESHFKDNADDGYNQGWFQESVYYQSRRLQPGESFFDPEVSTRIAYEIWLEQRWDPWPVCGL